VSEGDFEIGLASAAVLDIWPMVYEKVLGLVCDQVDEALIFGLWGHFIWSGGMVLGPGQTSDRSLF
jgi:hypothetical protein